MNRKHMELSATMELIRKRKEFCKEKTVYENSDGQLNALSTDKLNEAELNKNDMDLSSTSSGYLSGINIDKIQSNTTSTIGAVSTDNIKEILLNVKNCQEIKMKHVKVNADDTQNNAKLYSQISTGDSYKDITDSCTEYVPNLNNESKNIHKTKILKGVTNISKKQCSVAKSQLYELMDNVSDALSTEATTDSDLSLKETINTSINKNLKYPVVDGLCKVVSNKKDTFVEEGPSNSLLNLKDININKTETVKGKTSDRSGSVPQSEHICASPDKLHLQQDDKENTNDDMDLFEEFLIRRQEKQEADKQQTQQQQQEQQQQGEQQQQQQLAAQVSALQGDNVTLLKNISVLWKTAMSQLRKKQKQIVKLHQEKEALVFRRAARQVGRAELEQMLGRIASLPPRQLHAFMQVVQGRSLSCEKCNCDSREKHMKKKKPTNKVKVGSIVRGNKLDIRRSVSAKQLLRLLPDKREENVSMFRYHDNRRSKFEKDPLISTENTLKAREEKAPLRFTENRKESSVENIDHRRDEKKTDVEISKAQSKETFNENGHVLDNYRMYDYNKTSYGSGSQSKSNKRDQKYRMRNSSDEQRQDLDNERNCGERKEKNRQKLDDGYEEKKCNRGDMMRKGMTREALDLQNRVKRSNSLVRKAKTDLNTSRRKTDIKKTHMGEQRNDCNESHNKNGIATSYNTKSQCKEPSKVPTNSKQVTIVTTENTSKKSDTNSNLIKDFENIGQDKNNIDAQREAIIPVNIKDTLRDNIASEHLATSIKVASEILSDPCVKEKDLKHSSQDKPSTPKNVNGIETNKKEILGTIQTEVKRKKEHRYCEKDREAEFASVSEVNMNDVTSKKEDSKKEAFVENCDSFRNTETLLEVKPQNNSMENNKRSSLSSNINDKNKTPRKETSLVESPVKTASGGSNFHQNVSRENNTENKKHTENFLSKPSIKGEEHRSPRGESSSDRSARLSSYRTPPKENFIRVESVKSSKEIKSMTPRSKRAYMRQTKRSSEGKLPSFLVIKMDQEPDITVPKIIEESLRVRAETSNYNAIPMNVVMNRAEETKRTRGYRSLESNLRTHIDVRDQRYHSRRDIREPARDFNDRWRPSRRKHIHDYSDRSRSRSPLHCGPRTPSSPGPNRRGSYHGRYYHSGFYSDFNKYRNRDKLSRDFNRNTKDEIYRGERERSGSYQSNNSSERSSKDRRSSSIDKHERYGKSEKQQTNHDNYNKIIDKGEIIFTDSKNIHHISPRGTKQNLKNRGENNSADDQKTYKNDEKIQQSRHSDRSFKRRMHYSNVLEKGGNDCEENDAKVIQNKRMDIRDTIESDQNNMKVASSKDIRQDRDSLQKDMKGGKIKDVSTTTADAIEVLIPFPVVEVNKETNRYKPLNYLEENTNGLEEGEIAGSEDELNERLQESRVSLVENVTHDLNEKSAHHSLPINDAIVTQKYANSLELSQKEKEGTTNNGRNVSGASGIESNYSAAHNTHENNTPRLEKILFNDTIDMMVHTHAQNLSSYSIAHSEMGLLHCLNNSNDTLKNTQLETPNKDEGQITTFANVLQLNSSNSYEANSSESSRLIRRVRPTALGPNATTRENRLPFIQEEEMVPIKEYSIRPKPSLPASSVQVINTTLTSFRGSPKAKTSPSSSTQKRNSIKKVKNDESDAENLNSSDTSHTDSSDCSDDSFIADSSCQGETSSGDEGGKSEESTNEDSNRKVDYAKNRCYIISSRSLGLSLSSDEINTKSINGSPPKSNCSTKSDTGKNINSYRTPIKTDLNSEFPAANTRSKSPNKYSKRLTRSAVKIVNTLMSPLKSPTVPTSTARKLNLTPQLRSSPRKKTMASTSMLGLLKADADDNAVDFNNEHRSEVLATTSIPKEVQSNTISTSSKSSKSSKSSPSRSSSSSSSSSYSSSSSSSGSGTCSSSCTDTNSSKNLEVSKKSPCFSGQVKSMSDEKCLTETRTVQFVANKNNTNSLVAVTESRTDISESVNKVNNRTDEEIEVINMDGCPPLSVRKEPSKKNKSVFSETDSSNEQNSHNAQKDNSTKPILVEVAGKSKKKIASDKFKNLFYNSDSIIDTKCFSPVKSDSQYESIDLMDSKVSESTYSDQDQSDIVENIAVKKLFSYSIAKDKLKESMLVSSLADPSQILSSNSYNSSKSVSTSREETPTPNTVCRIKCKRRPHKQLSSVSSNKHDIVTYVYNAQENTTKPGVVMATKIVNSSATNNVTTFNGPLQSSHFNEDTKRTLSSQFTYTEKSHTSTNSPLLSLAPDKSSDRSVIKKVSRTPTMQNVRKRLLITPENMPAQKLRKIFPNAVTNSSLLCEQSDDVLAEDVIDVSCTTTSISNIKAGESIIGSLPTTLRPQESVVRPLFTRPALQESVTKSSLTSPAPGESVLSSLPASSILTDEVKGEPKLVTHQVVRIRISRKRRNLNLSCGK